MFTIWPLHSSLSRSTPISRHIGSNPPNDPTEPTQMVSQLSTSTESNPSNIYYVSTSVNAHHTFPCALCGQLDHFTYMCPLIIEYCTNQMTNIQNIQEALHATGPSTL
jgi:hypothetical protein